MSLPDSTYGVAFVDGNAGQAHVLRVSTVDVSKFDGEVCLPRSDAYIRVTPPRENLRAVKVRFVRGSQPRE